MKAGKSDKVAPSLGVYPVRVCAQELLYGLGPSPITT